MSVGPPYSRVYDDKILPSGANAASKKERLIVYNIAVNIRWTLEDVGMIQRVEKPGKRHHYAMWRYPKGVVK